MAFYFETEKNKRSANEDSFCHMEMRINLEASVSAMVVADGMGGLSDGKMYSETAVELWYRGLLQTMMGEGFRDCSLHQQIETLEEYSEHIFERINRRLYKKGLDAGVKGGTTLSTAIHFWDTWIIANCGDSPIYGMKNGVLSLLGEIQNVANQMVKKGTTKEGSSLFYQNKNRLTDYLGKRGEVHPFCARLSEKEADCILIGSDGAFGNLDLDAIEKIFNTQQAPGQMIKELFEQARASGEEDNQTVILYQKDEEKAMEIFQSDMYQELKLEEAFSGAVTPLCSYTEVPKQKKEPGLMDWLFRHRGGGGKNK
ncbi:MAG: serine/threonine-protein phosphatase [Eubacteriales bacterium]|nr:serine/threonine-protein phosphatase [Eubacteriales bacterium]